MNLFLNKARLFNFATKIPLAMRLIILFLILFTGVTWAENTYAQNTKISIDAQNQTIANILENVEQQSEFSFIYDSKSVDTERKVSVRAENENIFDVLSQMFAGSDIAYTVVNKKIILNKGDEMLSPAQQQPANLVTGTVTDEKGESIPGVNVSVKSTSIGVVTDVNGKYSLNIPNKNVVLVFSYLGYIAQEISVGNQTQIDVRMKEDTQSLNEVVVVGYGTLRKSDLTGSISSVKSDKLLNRPVNNIAQSLQAKVAGVEVFQNSGTPGGNIRMRIRGDNSIKATNEPLFVVDGIIGITSDLLNPNDIESIEVLKDASATAIYGARGANGVVLVTTKRGIVGKPIIDYNCYVSTGHLRKKIPVLNSEEFMKVYDQLYVNAEKYDPKGFAEGKHKKNQTSNFPKLFDSNGKPLYDTDWQDEAYRTSLSINHQLSLRGGVDKTNYGLFLNYYDAEGIMLESWMKRYSGKMTLDSEVKKWLTIGGSIFINYQSENRTYTMTDTGAAPRSILETLPIIPVKYPDGTWGSNRDWPGTEDDNPVRLLKERSRLGFTTQMLGDVFLNFKITNDLSLKTSFATELVNTKNNSYTSKGLRIATTQNGIAQINASRQYYWQNENYFNYSKIFNDDNRLNAMLGLSWQQRYYEYVSAEHQNFSDDFYQWHNLGVGTVVRPSSSSDWRWALNSYFARINYNYKNRYLATITGRFDGSSKFGINNKYAFFPSAALAWRASQESFLQNNKLISNLKFRTSYGVTGNQEIGNYAYAQNLGSTNIIINNAYQTALFRNSFGNPDLKWEKTLQYDAGVDISFFNNRVEIIADYYHKTTKDLLLDAPIPSTSGLTTVTKNIGSILNQGIELTLNTHNIKSDKLNWYTTLNWSMNKNKVLQLGVNNEDIFPGPYQGGDIIILRVGEPVGAFWGKVREGTWKEAEASQAAVYGRLPGDLKYKDLNNDNLINNNDETIIGYSSPDWVANMSNTLVLNNIDFTLDIRIMYGNDVFNRPKMTLENRSGIANSMKTVLDCWSPTNQNSQIAERRPTTAYFDYMHDTWLIEDGSFLRIQNLMLGYTFPSLLVKKIGLEKLRLYVSGQNLFCFTKYTGYDPECTTYDQTFAQGIDFFTYPKPRTITFGLNLSF